VRCACRKTITEESAQVRDVGLGEAAEHRSVSTSPVGPLRGGHAHQGLYIGIAQEGRIDQRAAS